MTPYLFFHAMLPARVFRKANQISLLARRSVLSASGDLLATHATYPVELQPSPVFDIYRAHSEAGPSSAVCVAGKWFAWCARVMQEGGRKGRVYLFPYFCCKPYAPHNFPDLKQMNAAKCLLRGIVSCSGIIT